MDEYGLIGCPLGHSWSQAYFTDMFTRLGLRARYLNFPIASLSELPALLRAHPRLRGFNVTIPYKQAIIPLLHRLSPEAARIGAVNVVSISRPAALSPAADSLLLTGHNTDCLGFAAALAPHLQPRHLASGTRALVLGTGGAARAVAVALRDMAIEPLMVSRRAPAPAADATPTGVITYAHITPALMAEAPIIVNCTPLGMHPKVDACPPIPYQWLTPRHLCFDLVYNPAATLFLRRAAAAGAATAGGLAMLHAQARAAWQIWTNPGK